MLKLWLWVECGLLFVVAPVLVSLTLRQAPWLLALGAVTAGAAVWLWQHGEFGAAQFWCGDDVEAERRQLKQLLGRFVLCTLGLLAITMLFFPAKLFLLPRTMPLQWGLLLATYPALSVYPQELLYRAFFARRYQPLYKRAERLLPLSALLFGWLHVIFQNPLAVLLTVAGGWFFTQTYNRTHSLRLVCLEHTLYGSAIFSLGLGEFFMQSALPR